MGGAEQRFTDCQIDAALQEAELLLGLEGSQGSKPQSCSDGRPWEDSWQEQGPSADNPHPLHVSGLNEEEHSTQVQQKLEQLLHSREAQLSTLQDAVDLRDQALEKLAEQLRAYQGLGPDAVAVMQREHAVMSAEKGTLEQSIGDMRQRLAQQGQRLSDSLQCWERVQAELQQENAMLAGTLAQRTADYQDVLQEKEVLRAKLGLLEARAHHNSMAVVPVSSPAAVAPASLPAAHALATEQAEQLRAKLSVAADKLEARDATCRKYKEAVRALKRRVAELEQQLQLKEAEAQAVQDEQRQGHERSADVAAGMAKLEELLQEARQQCQAYRGRLSELEQQLQRREFERAQWEWRAQDAESKAAAAEERAQAGSEAADAGHAAALRLAEQRAGQAEARAAEKEAQAKAASLQVLHLEKQVARLRAELDELRRQYGARSREAEVQQHQQQQGTSAEVSRLQELVRSKQAALVELQQRLATAESRHKQVEQSLREQAQSKGVALVDAEKRFKQLESVMRRLAAKKQQALQQGSTEQFLIGTRVV
ncbi:hypothetical protein N2152v2_002120 [Parachlorella kessleri]